MPRYVQLSSWKRMTFTFVPVLLYSLFLHSTGPRSWNVIDAAPSFPSVPHGTSVHARNAFWMTARVSSGSRSCVPSLFIANITQLVGQNSAAPSVGQPSSSDGHSWLAVV